MRLQRAAAIGSALLMGALSTSGAFAMGAGHHVYRSKDKGGYRLVLKIGPAAKMGGMRGEHMINGKMQTCAMKMHMSRAAEAPMGSAKKCNHHVELHVYNRKTGTPVQGATVTIRLYCIKRKMSIHVPIAEMMSRRMGLKDYHYGNNVHTPTGIFNVFVDVNGVRAEFPLVHLT